MRVRVESANGETFRGQFLIQPLDSEGYRRVLINYNGGWSFYGDWSPELHPDFQSWLDYIIRPGTLKIVSVEGK